MDKYEEALKIATLKTLSQIDINLENLAEERLQQFVATLTRLLVNEQEKFDLVISGGDSGLIVTKIVEKIYEVLKIKVPPIINLPIQRYKDGNLQQRFQHVDLVKDIPSIKNVENILFVDDEIRIGWTAKTCFETLQKKYKTRLHCVIIAENHFFEWHFKQPDVNLRFYAHAKVIPGINQIFAYLINNQEYNLIQSLSDQIQDRQQAVALLISAKYKKFSEKKVLFDEKLELEILNKSSKYRDIKKKLENKLTSLVKNGVARYKSGDISFKF